MLWFTVILISLSYPIGPQGIASQNYLGLLLLHDRIIATTVR